LKVLASGRWPGQREQIKIERMDGMKRLIVFLLTLKDIVLNVITLGLYGRWQGSKRIAVYK